MGPHRVPHRDLQINGIEPFAYLEATIASGHPKSRIDDLLPWNLRSSS